MRTMRDVSSRSCVALEHCESSCSEQARVAPQLTRDESHLANCNRLCPPLRLVVNAIEELRRRPEHATAKNDHLGIEQTDEIRRCHSPQLDGIVDDSRRNRVPAMLRPEDIRR